MVNCYKRLGDLKKDLHESAMNYCKALIQKRLLMPKDKR
jgi:tetratricopeptide (TPR) repeat protein